MKESAAIVSGFVNKPRGLFFLPCFFDLVQFSSSVLEKGRSSRGSALLAKRGLLDLIGTPPYGKRGFLHGTDLLVACSQIMDHRAKMGGGGRR